MKRTMWVVLAAGALGVWGGLRSWNSPSGGAMIQAAAAILIGGNLVFMTWLWSRARPGSGEALALPGPILLSVSMLVGLTPRLFWPGAEALQIGASIISIAFTAVVVVWILRRNRFLRIQRNT